MSLSDKIQQASYLLLNWTDRLIDPFSRQPLNLYCYTALSNITKKFIRDITFDLLNFHSKVNVSDIALTDIVEDDDLFDQKTGILASMEDPRNCQFHTGFVVNDWVSSDDDFSFYTAKDYLFHRVYATPNFH